MADVGLRIKQASEVRALESVAFSSVTGMLPHPTLFPPPQVGTSILPVRPCINHPSESPPLAVGLVVKAKGEWRWPGNRGRIPAGCD